MDIFMEKIVAKKRDSSDMLIIGGIILAAIILILLFSMFAALPIVRSFFPILIVGVIYGAYVVIKSRNIEFEYIVTNGELDIDKIIARRKRKRIFSAHCKEFDIVARVNSPEYNNNVQSINKKIVAVSSMQSEGAYFAVLDYKGGKTVVFFEPDSRMLESFKTFIPRKVMI